MKTKIDANALYQQQLEVWEDFRLRVKQLETIQTRKFETGEYCVIAQFNPARAVSSGAKLDKKSIAERKCFLCETNRPDVQKGVDLNERFTLLVNPFPILKKHFTIPLKFHQNQEILPYFSELLSFMKLLPDYTLFYNGPQCGASAPDHMHFQAVEKGQLPLEWEWKSIKKEVITETKELRVERFLNYDRKCIHIASNVADSISHYFLKLYNNLQLECDTIEEPKMNLFGFYEEDIFHIFIFHRKTHRPKQFFEDNENFRMISPGAIDIAGILVLPRKEDYDTICEEEIKDVFHQVSF
ncbi:MAG: DUF4922 domain-containing protein [Paludibacteraceae bacterium]|nr:DUF4922 domain-containing protein [Paludibacteraceae bacterium]